MKLLRKISACRLLRDRQFLYIENPTLGVGGSEALKAMKLDKKTPFGVG